MGLLFPMDVIRCASQLLHVIVSLSGIDFLHIGLPPVVHHVIRCASVSMSVTVSGIDFLLIRLPPVVHHVIRCASVSVTETVSGISFHIGLPLQQCFVGPLFTMQSAVRLSQ